MGDDPIGRARRADDTVSFYFLNATLASAFVARWCAGYTVETKDGVFRIRDDEPAPRIGAPAASDALSLAKFPSYRRGDITQFL